jgi:hypothetical protein
MRKSNNADILVCKECGSTNIYEETMRRRSINIGILISDTFICDYCDDCDDVCIIETKENFLNAMVLNSIPGEKNF